MRRLMPTLALFVAASAVQAQELRIKEFALGGDLRTQAEKAGMSCGAGPEGGLIEWCRPRGERAAWVDAIKTLASIPTRFVVVGGFDGKLGTVNWTFDHGGFDTVADAYKQRFPAMKCTNSVVQNRLGAQFEQTECELTTKAFDLVIVRRTESDLTVGRLHVATQEHYRRGEGEHKKKRGAAKSDS